MLNTLQSVEISSNWSNIQVAHIEQQAERSKDRTYFLKMAVKRIAVTRCTWTRKSSFKRDRFFFPFDFFPLLSSNQRWRCTNHQCYLHFIFLFSLRPVLQELTALCFACSEKAKGGAKWKSKKQMLFDVQRKKKKYIVLATFLWSWIGNRILQRPADSHIW